VAAAAQSGGARGAGRSMDVHGCMYSRCSAQIDDWPKLGALQIRRKIRWWS